MPTRHPSHRWQGCRLLDRRNGNGATPLLEATHGSVVKILLENGARADVLNEERESALYMAKRLGEEEVVRFLAHTTQIQAMTDHRSQHGNHSKYGYQPLSTATSIRLLELHPGQGNDILSLELHEVDLNEQPQFEALSYEWGKKEGSLLMECSGRNLEITPNLQSVLKTLRSKDGARFLWADAVCINQEDIAERSQQVTLMGRIFRKASSVIMWIGKETDDTETAFALVAIFSRLYDALSVAPTFDTEAHKSRDIGGRVLQHGSRDVARGSWLPSGRCVFV